MVGGEIHAAVSQTQNYLRALDEERHRIKAEFGIDPRRLHATVVIGHVD
jgi:predicted transcriptional regulator